MYYNDDRSAKRNSVTVSTADSDSACWGSNPYSSAKKDCYLDKITILLSFYKKKKQVNEMILYRPVGSAELDLIKQQNFAGFPPRLPEQPIFYPVLNEEYACEIAEKWNSKSSDEKGFVTRFTVDDDYISQYDVHIVGSHLHKELWIPAEELSMFNSHIIGLIEVIREFCGDIT